MVERTFRALEVSSNAVLLAQRMEILVAAGDQLVRVGLMTHVPDDLVLVQIQGLVQSQGELHHPQTGAEMAATGGNHLQMAFPDLTCDVFELDQTEPVQFIRMGQISEMHAHAAPGSAIYGVCSWRWIVLNVRRMIG